jgi:hypothetical protein
MISKQGNGSVLFCRCNYLKQLNEAGISGAVSTPSRKRFDAAPPFALVHLAIFQDTASGMARICSAFRPGLAARDASQRRAEARRDSSGSGVAFVADKPS